MPERAPNSLARAPRVGCSSPTSAGRAVDEAGVDEGLGLRNVVGHSDLGIELSSLPDQFDNWTWLLGGAEVGFVLLGSPEPEVSQRGDEVLRLHANAIGHDRVCLIRVRLDLLDRAVVGADESGDRFRVLR